jgi:chromosome segregation ATPase
MLDWLEREIHGLKETTARYGGLLDQLQAQIHDLATEISQQEGLLRQNSEQLRPLLSVPEEVRQIRELLAKLQKQIGDNRAAGEDAVRLLRAELERGRGERKELLERVERVERASAEIKPLFDKAMNSSLKAAQASHELVSRQNEIEASQQNQSLRVERMIEVSRGIEVEVGRRLAHVEELFKQDDILFERVQLLGEMTRRIEEDVDALRGQVGFRQDVIERIDMYRSEYNRLDERLAVLEALVADVEQAMRLAESTVNVIEGRHTGLSERVQNIRTEMGALVDEIGMQFDRYNKLQEKHKQRQVDDLQKELRELKYHAFKPPAEPQP